MPAGRPVKIASLTSDLSFLLLCTVFTTQDVNEKFSVKQNAPHRLHLNFITCRFLKVQWQSEQGLEDLWDPCVSKSGTFSSFFFDAKFGSEKLWKVDEQFMGQQKQQSEFPRTLHFLRIKEGMEEALCTAIFDLFRLLIIEISVSFPNSTMCTRRK